MTQADSPKILEVENLRVGKPEPGGRVLVKNASFFLRAGEALGIVGESGSGKTLTACAVCGLLPPSLSVLGGRVAFDGRSIDPGNSKKLGFKRGRDILMLFQSPSSALDPTMPVGSQIAETLWTENGRGRRQSERRARKLMETVDLPDNCFERYPFQLSGGQRQRALLAMAFGLRPRVLVADEPTAGQDHVNRDHILDLLVRLRKEAGTACVVVTHDLRILSRLADRVVVLYRGEQVESGRFSEIFRDPVHPHTRELVDAMRRLEQAS